MTETYDFVFLIVKIILLSLILSLSLPVAVKPHFFNSSFNSILQLMNEIFSDIQISLKYFISAAIVTILRNPFAPSALVFYESFLYMKDSKSISLAIFALILVGSSLE